MVDRTPHSNVELLRAVYADFRLLNEFARQDMVLHAAGSRGILTGDYVGKQAVLARVLELYRRSGGSLVLSADDIVANDHFGVVLGRLAANRAGRRLEGEVCGVWRFQDGLIVEHWENCADWPAAERFLIDEFDEEADAEPADARHSTG
ncbi:ketosteroid isomerase-like protein [Kibdelosporangium banguiense]|uniref:Ketosteroid isomerase-like protein n=1 Tax=Kibdelosporangium banguiense TaxID=1365924 RepID=A0ABS4TT51_9PSEU|nr:nuclear transport factor 2 family protein [Kibdelosporangium banguiense]MBP2327567.1 ketosteroid isomerase-like protein [Kibdelosporangium banguiense]